jgi:hypothetical protein
MAKSLLDEMVELALNSGGCIKFDLKAWDENLHIALTGITNKRTIENFSRAGEKVGWRPKWRRKPRESKGGWRSPWWWDQGETVVKSQQFH